MGLCLCWGWDFQLVEDVQEMGFVGEAFVVEWAFSVGWASDWEEIRCWLSNCTGAGDIGKWGCEGFVGTLAMWEL